MREMEDDRNDPPDGRIPANDNTPKPGEAEGGDNDTPLQRLDRVVLDIARLIGRQMARENFERLRADNDNGPDDGKQKR